VSCLEKPALIHGYLDGELDLVNSLQVEDHLRECAICDRIYRNLQILQSAVRGGNLYFQPAEGFAARLHSALQDSARAGRPALTSIRQPAKPSRWWTWQAVAVVAACLALVAAVVFRFAPGVSRTSHSDLVAQEVLASHVRSLMASHLTDVPSSDQHTVKPWFDGKLDFSPPLQDLSSKGFPLVGGRLDYLVGRPVAALVYQRQRHFINLFIWPSSNNSREEVMMQQGYNIHHLAESNMTY
jgi:anti-sigma factor RsiW